MSVVQALPLFLCLSVWSAPRTQFALNIVHEPVVCITAGQYPVIEAAVPAGTDLRSAKVYFRSDKYPKFYFVEMTREANGLRSVLPKPSPETEHIIYYIEAVDVSFNNTIDAEHTAEISNQCERLAPKDDDPLLVDPSIIVGATEAGAPSLPPGFEAAGIIGSLSSAGLLSGLGGGPGIGTAAIIGGAAAGVGGAAVVVTGSEGESTAEPNEPPPEPTTPSTPPTSTGPQPPNPTNPQPPEPTDPQPPAPTPTDPTTPPPTGPTTPPPTDPTTPTPPPPDPTTPTPPPPDPTTPTPPDPPAPPPPPSSVTACFEASFPGGSCNMKLDAACSSGTITAYDWVISAPSALGGTTVHSGSKVNHNFATCSGESVTVTLTVSDGGSASDSTVQTISLPVSQRLADLQTSLVSSLTVGARDAVAHGRVVLNDVKVDATNNSAPFRHAIEGRPGENTVEAVLVSQVGRETYWKFDFSQAEHFVPGSIRPEQGSVISLDNRQVVFRLSGATQERIRFKVRMGSGIDFLNFPSRPN